MKKFNFVYCSHLFFKLGLLIFVPFGILIFSIGCGSALYIPSESDATQNASIDELKQGRSLYVNNCGGCHALVLPEKYNKEEWGVWLAKMKDKTTTSEAEDELILKYITKGK